VELPAIADIARNLVADGLAEPGPDALRAAILLLAAAEQVNGTSAEFADAAAPLCAHVA
jgi:hypothetical protein